MSVNLQPVESIWVVPLQMTAHLHQPSAQGTQLYKAIRQESELLDYHLVQSGF